MRRLIATFVVTALLSISVSATLQHVHAYGDHDHAEHQHGLAAHMHIAPAHHHDDDVQATAEIEGCDPGAHAVSVVFTCTSSHPHHAPLPAVVEVFVFVPALMPLRAMPPADVRAHGPPRLSDAPVRAPPLVTPA